MATRPAVVCSLIIQIKGAEKRSPPHRGGAHKGTRFLSDGWSISTEWIDEFQKTSKQPSKVQPDKTQKLKLRASVAVSTAQYSPLQNPCTEQTGQAIANCIEPKKKRLMIPVETVCFSLHIHNHHTLLLHQNAVGYRYSALVSDVNNALQTHMWTTSAEMRMRTRTYRLPNPCKLTAASSMS